MCNIVCARAVVFVFVFGQFLELHARDVKAELRGREHRVYFVLGIACPNHRRHRHHHRRHCHHRHRHRHHHHRSRRHFIVGRVIFITTTTAAMQHPAFSSSLMFALTYLACLLLFPLHLNAAPRSLHPA